ncbi:S-layer homology domain-containing protein [Paenibacillus hexagrammi]|uniref:S-layer homology domain-containing protein n=1 Tax=Paenibacillus hexagrammi TaxID=2908839 RepID=A0ABY3SG26_9BACL|nr:S-layer homology domain-containing protein [Paenibacillus sp. YPD9-1]UJF32984.1 S-layer homology domain-containing protein [Paenibacillus sp. YPD9-1]
MKKTLSLLAASTMAFSFFATSALVGPQGTASAAEAAVKTSASFTDLQDIDAGLKAKIDAMLEAKIFEGVSEDSFGIHENMTRAQFAKVATLIFGIEVDHTVKVSSFADVHADDPANGWAIPYIEAAKKAGLIDGITDTTFAPGDQVTTGQLDTILLKGLGKKVSMTESPWYADAVKQATGLGIHPAGKAGDTAADRSDLVTSSYATNEQIKPTTPETPAAEQTPVSVKSAQASSDNKKITVTLDGEVDTTKATLALTKGTASVQTTVAWASDKKSATLTADSALDAGDYTVTLGGLDASQVKTAAASFTVAASSTSTSTGSTTYTTKTYELANVLDSGLTDAATGLNGLETQVNAENPTVSKFAKEIEINVTSGGDAVAVPGLVETITSTDPSVVAVGVTADHHGYAIGKKAGTATLNILFKAINGDIKTMQANVTVKSDSVAGKTMEVGNTSYEASSSTFNAYEAMDLKIVDNYGIEYEKDEIQKYNFALATLFITNHVEGDKDAGATGTVEVAQDGTVTITGNVTSFELTSVLPSGAEATTYVTVK